MNYFLVYFIFLSSFLFNSASPISFMIALADFEFLPNLLLICPVMSFFCFSKSLEICVVIDVIDLHRSKLKSYHKTSFVNISLYFM